MTELLTQYLPSLSSLGVWGYWFVALLVLGQGFAPTSILSPASVVVVFAGGLCAQGIYDLGDMIWFVGLADAVGGVLSFRLGQHMRGTRKTRFISTANMARGRALFAKFGGPGVLLGRFLPMGAFVPLIAGLADMERRRFHIWNVLGAFTYSGAALFVGYFFGSVMAMLGAWTTRVGVVLLALFAVLGLLWFIGLQLVKAAPFMKSVGRSVAQAVRENPDVQALARRHPKTARFVRGRLTMSQFSGLPTSLFAVILIYFLWLYGTSVLDEMGSGTIAQADIRLAALMSGLRDAATLRFFIWVSAFGNARSMLVLVMGVSLLFLRSRQWRELALVWLVPIGASLTTVFLKLLFARPRPEQAVYVLSDFSFPSGHATGAMALFALLAWLMVRNRWMRPSLAVIMAGTVIFLIGVSRLYLGVHYLSDVLNGYLVGAIWALGGIWWLEWRGHGQAHPAPASVAMRLSVLVAAVVLGLGAGLTQVPILSQKSTPIPRQLDRPVAEAFSAGLLPKMTETLLGEGAQPISLVLLVPDREALQALVTQAGWQQADPPTPANLAHAAIAVWFGEPYETAPITPAFWQARPHEMGFQRSTETDNLRQRHHARFWDSGTKSQDGLAIFVGTTSFDDGLKWGLTHHIDPNIDAERDLFVQGLVATGAFATPETLPLVPPVLGRNLVGDAFFTDGNAVLLRAK